MSLKRSADRKTANSATSSANVAIRNAFGLPSGRAYSCPGATSVCESVCYAGKIERQYPNVMASALHNWAMVKDATFGELTFMLGAMVEEFRLECVKRSAPMEFRIHHDGDFFSRTYADAWATVVRMYPEIQFWVYTRSFTPGINVVDLIADIPNLAVYLSVDAINKGYATTIRDEFPSVRFALLADTAADAALELAELGTRGGICPENVKRIPLITSEGGACHSCQLCVFAKCDIRFAIRKR